MRVPYVGLVTALVDLETGEVRRVEVGINTLEDDGEPWIDAYGNERQRDQPRTRPGLGNRQGRRLA